MILSLINHTFNDTTHTIPNFTDFRLNIWLELVSVEVIWSPMWKVRKLKDITYIINDKMGQSITPRKT